MIQELFSSNNFFLAQKSIQFDPETSLYPPTLAFSSATSLKLITENWRQAPVGVSGVRFVYVRVNLAIFLRKIAIFGDDFWQIVDPLQFFLFMLRYGGWEAAL